MRLTIQFLCGILCFHFNICLCNYLFNISHQLLSENETLITILVPPMNRKLKCTLSYTKASTKSHHATSMYTINSTPPPCTHYPNGTRESESMNIALKWRCIVVNPHRIAVTCTYRNKILKYSVQRCCTDWQRDALMHSTQLHYALRIMAFPKLGWRRCQIGFGNAVKLFF